MTIKKIIKTIKGNKRFLITTHVNPDPDGLCSELAFAQYLKSLGKKVDIVNSEETPKRFHFLPNSKQIKGYAYCQYLDYDVAIILDCGELNRIGKVKKLINKNKILINIDHHHTNSKFGDLNLVMSKASATCEVIYLILNEVNYKLNKNLAINLYVGIMTDTGSFRYENTTLHTHSIVSDLMKFDFSVTDLYSKLYETIPLNDLKVLTKIITQFEVLNNGKVLYVQLSKKILSKFSEQFDLREVLFKFLRSIQGVELIVILTEVSKSKTKVNFRSSDKVNVASLANIFNGGGHKRASGCLVNSNIATTRKKLLRKINDIL